MMRTKPRPRFLTMSFSFVVLLVLMLSACGGAGPSSSTTSTTGTPVKGGTWIEDLYEEPPSLIPNFPSSTFADMVMYGLYAPLIYGTPHGQLMPGIATPVPTVANRLVSADLTTVSFHLRSVTRGAFRMSETKSGHHCASVRIQKYCLAAQGLPYLDKVVWRIVNDQTASLKDVQSGGKDSAWFLDVSKALAYEQLSDYSTIGDGGGTGTNSYSWEAIWINFNNKILGGNPEVRQAMSMAVDQQSLIHVARRRFAGAPCQDHPAMQMPGHT